MRMRPRVLKIALLLALVVATVAGGPASAKAPGFARFSGNGVSFPYPKVWKPQFRDNWDIHYEGIVVALSTERLHKPCVVFYNPDGSIKGSRCGFQNMLDTLPPDGVFVTWTIDDSPRFTPGVQGYPGNPTRIAGVPAKIIGDGTGAAIPGFCPKATTASITAFFAPPNRPPVIMAACTRTTNFDAFRAQIRMMLRTLSFRR